jgi:hypothetical protein
MGEQGRDDLLMGVLLDEVAGVRYLRSGGGLPTKACLGWRTAMAPASNRRSRLMVSARERGGAGWPSSDRLGDEADLRRAIAWAGAVLTAVGVVGLFVRPNLYVVWVFLIVFAAGCH